MKRVLIVVTALWFCGCTAAVPAITAWQLWLIAAGIKSSLSAPAEPKRLTMEQVCDPARDKRDDIPAFVALCPSTP